jgi:hypothetical protein
MNKRASYVAVALVVAFICLVAAPGWAASRFSVSVDQRTVFSGQTLRVTASARGTCSEWGISWAGQTSLQRNTRTAIASFTAPDVDAPTTFRVTAICVYAGAVDQPHRPGTPARTPGRDPQTVTATIPLHWIGTVPVTVDPSGGVVNPPGGGHHHHHGGGHGTGPGGITLPNTGGPRLIYLLLALCSLLTGTVAVRAGLRRREP